jgi:L,D-transpeptidase ErfK/SrfK
VALTIAVSDNAYRNPYGSMELQPCVTYRSGSCNKMPALFAILTMVGPEILSQFSDRQPRARMRHLVMLAFCVLFLHLHGCAATRDLLATLPLADKTPNSIAKNHFPLDADNDVIGRLASVRLEPQDTLPDIARHFSLGLDALSAANPGVDVWVPRAGERIVLPLGYILPEGNRKGIVINLPAMRLFHFRTDGERQAVSTYPVGVGTVERPTPMGRMHITRKKVRPTWYVPASIAADHRKKGDPLPGEVPPGPLNPLGEYALYLSKPSYLIHGTNKPASIGLRATNGCIRLYPEDIKRLFDATKVKTPVIIVHQPYLVGRHDDVVYLEAHAPFEDLAKAELEKTFLKLKQIEAETGHALDWSKIKKVVAETRGIPVAVSAGETGGETAFAKTIRIRHPVELYGQPQVPELRTDAWYVLAATVREKVDARRLAAIINHQGPQIPARVLSKHSRHRVLAGPFDNQGEAKNAAKRLRIDLEIDAVLVAPVDQKPPDQADG